MPVNPKPTFPEYKKLREHAGEPYEGVLRRIHALVAPQRYLEVGVNEGRSLALATCASVGVDPAFRLTTDVIGNKPMLALVQATSDDFFLNTDVQALLKGPPDLIFLDGLHHAEVLLRDFVNSEAVAAAGSLIVMHDCLPTDVFMARRDQFDADLRSKTPTPAAWSGDVWKTAEAIRRYRPDLTMISLDAPPTGLLIITNLNPASDVLSSRYDEIVRSFESRKTSNDSLVEFLNTMNITSTDQLDSLLSRAKKVGERSHSRAKLDPSSSSASALRSHM